MNAAHRQVFTAILCSNHASAVEREKITTKFAGGEVAESKLESFVDLNQ